MLSPRGRCCASRLSCSHRVGDVARVGVEARHDGGAVGQDRAGAAGARRILQPAVPRSASAVTRRSRSKLPHASKEKQAMLELDFRRRHSENAAENAAAGGDRQPDNPASNFKQFIENGRHQCVGIWIVKNLADCHRGFTIAKKPHAR